jgi:hypothetical protein
MTSKYQIFPIKVTKEEHEAVTIYRSRKEKKAEVDEKTERLVGNSVKRLIGMIAGHENSQIHEAEPNFSEAIHSVSE